MLETTTINGTIAATEEKTIKSCSSLMNYPDMNFSMGSISLSGSAKITGDTGTNSQTAGSIAFEWLTAIDGDLFIGPGAQWSEVINGSKPDSGDHVTGEIANLPSARNYRMPAFPEFAELTDRGDLTAGWWPEGPFIINESGSYGSITVDNKLSINVGDMDVLIKADNLFVKGSGSIAVNRTGTGRVIFYVSDRMEVSGGGSINNGGSFEDVVICYSGSNKLSFNGNTRIAGSIFAKAADVEISGSGAVTGHIVAGGGKVSLSGNAQKNSGVIYAPGADLSLSGSSSIKGIAIAKSMALAGTSQINFDNSMSFKFFEQLN